MKKSALRATVTHEQGVITGGRVEYVRSLDDKAYFHELGRGARILLVTVPRHGRCLLLVPRAGAPLWMREDE